MPEPSFYILSEGAKNGVSSHDTSRAGFHHQDLAAFCEDVNSAARRAFPNRGPSRYETVNVCLIRWEDDELGVQRELGALNNVLQDYGFQTNVFLIPSLNSHWDLMRKTLDFIQACDNEQNLFVLYYAGHGRMNSARQAEWVFGQGPNSPFVDWSAIQGLFGTAKSDVLILLDTCAAASSASTSQFAVIETIAACGFERRAPPPGEHSLTNTLIDVLRDWINKPSFSAASLHTEILFRLKHKETKKGREGMPLEWCVTPIYWINTIDRKASGIEICRRNILPSPSATPPTEAYSEEDSSTFVDAMDIDFDDTSLTSTPLSSVSSTGSYKVPHVLITLQLEENQPLDAKQCARWLDKFPLLAKWVKVEAVFPSYSTLMILSIPMPIWDMLPDHPACSFIGYVTSPKIGGPSLSEEVPPTEVPTLKKTSGQAYGDIVVRDDSSGGAVSLTKKDERNTIEEEAYKALSDADTTGRSLQGFTPSDMATSEEVLQPAQRSEHHSRNRSGGSLRSKTSDVTSLRSEWKPSIPAPADTTALDEDNDNYPHEYEDEDADAADDRAFWMSPRRPGAQKPLQSDLANEKDTILELLGTSATKGLASPIAAMTKWRELFGTIPASPPAYEDIIHQGDVDAKRALAVQAAAATVADNNCAEVFDQAESSTTAQKRSIMLETGRIGQKHTITREQQAQLRLAYAEKVKRLSRDRNIFFIWIPLLVIIMLAMLYNRVPKAWSEASTFISSMWNRNEPQQHDIETV